MSLQFENPHVKWDPHPGNPRIKRKFWKISERKLAWWEQHLTSPQQLCELEGSGRRLQSLRVKHLHPSCQSKVRVDWLSFVCTSSQNTVLTQNICQEALGGGASPEQGRKPGEDIGFSQQGPNLGESKGWTGPQGHGGWGGGSSQSMLERTRIYTKSRDSLLQPKVYKRLVIKH